MPFVGDTEDGRGTEPPRTDSRGQHNGRRARCVMAGLGVSARSGLRVPELLSWNMSTHSPSGHCV